MTVGLADGKGADKAAIDQLSALRRSNISRVATRAKAVLVRLTVPLKSIMRLGSRTRRMHSLIVRKDLISVVQAFFMSTLQRDLFLTGGRKPSHSTLPIVTRLTQEEESVQERLDKALVKLANGPMK